MEYRTTVLLCRGVTTSTPLQGTKSNTPVLLFQDRSGKTVHHKLYRRALALYSNTHLNDATLAKLRLEMLAASETLQLPVDHNAYSRAKCISFFHTVGSKNDCTRLHGFGNDAPHEAPTRRIHARRRLIQIYDFGISKECNCNTEFPLVSSAEVPRQLVSVAFEIHFLEHRINFILKAGFGVAFDTAIHHQMLASGHIRPESVELATSNDECHFDGEEGAPVDSIP
jgi:hypothetical protein